MTSVDVFLLCYVYDMYVLGQRTIAFSCDRSFDGFCLRRKTSRIFGQNAHGTMI